MNVDDKKFKADLGLSMCRSNMACMGTMGHTCKPVHMINAMLAGNITKNLLKNKMQINKIYTWINNTPRFISYRLAAVCSEVDATKRVD